MWDMVDWANLAGLRTDLAPSDVPVRLMRAVAPLDLCEVYGFVLKGEGEKNSAVQHSSAALRKEGEVVAGHLRPAGVGYSESSCVPPPVKAS